MTGNTCPRGDAYAREEVTAPARTVTSTIPVTGGGRKVRIPCKTASDVPKQKIFEVMAQIHKAGAKAPVRRGDVLIRNVAGTGVDVIAAPRRAADKSRARREVPSHSPAARPARDIMQQYTASRGEGPRLVNTLGDYHEEICNGA